MRLFGSPAPFFEYSVLYYTSYRRYQYFLDRRPGKQCMTGIKLLYATSPLLLTDDATALGLRAAGCVLRCRCRKSGEEGPLPKKKKTRARRGPGVRCLLRRATTGGRHCSPPSGPPAPGRGALHLLAAVSRAVPRPRDSANRSRRSSGGPAGACPARLRPRGGGPASPRPPRPPRGASLERRATPLDSRGTRSSPAARHRSARPRRKRSPRGATAS